MATAYAGNNSIIEVVLVSADEDGNAEVAFGPKAYAALTVQAAVVKATAEFINDGGDASSVVDARTRFFG